VVLYNFATNLKPTGFPSFFQEFTESYLDLTPSSHGRLRTGKSVLLCCFKQSGYFELQCRSGGMIKACPLSLGLNNHLGIGIKFAKLLFTLLDFRRRAVGGHVVDYASICGMVRQEGGLLLIPLGSFIDDAATSLYFQQFHIWGTQWEHICSFPSSLFRCKAGSPAQSACTHQC